MERRRIILMAGIFTTVLSAVCFLWHAGTAKESGAFSKCILQEAGMLEKPEAKREIKEREGQEEKQKIRQWAGQEWVVEEDGQDSLMGRNFSRRGCYILQEGDCLFAAGLEFEAGAMLYGGRNVPDEISDYNIYRLKDHVWEVFVSHPPESVDDEEIMRHHYWDETYVSNLVYYDGFLYYSLMYDQEPSMGGIRPEYIYRVPVQGGEAERLALAYDTFYIYNGKIYYMALEGKTEKYGDGEYVYYEMEPDGTGRRELYRRKEEWLNMAFAVGGGCLYAEEADGNRIMGVNLKTGEKKYYGTSELDIESLCYEDGCLYIWCTSGGSSYTGILRMDVVSGEKERLTGVVSAAWLESGYLYYVCWYDGNREDAELTLFVLDLETKQSSAEVLAEEGGSMLQTVGDELVVSVTVYNNHIKEKTTCFKYSTGTLPLERLDRKEKKEGNP